MKLDAPKITWS